MIIRFKTGNFKSVKEEVELDFVASNYDKTMLGNLIDLKEISLSKVKLVKGVALYCANASGKSNVLNAIKFMVRFVVNSATRISPGGETGVIPFCLDEKCRHSPSSFEMAVLIDGIRYCYGFSLDNARVHEEHLTAYPKGVAQHWFKREFTPETNEYSWNNSESFFKLDKDLASKTRDNCLFLSVGAQFNNQQLTTVYNFFRNTLVFFDLSNRGLFPSFTADIIEKQDSKAEAVKRMLRLADFGVCDISVISEMKELEQVPNLPPSLVESLKKDGETKLRNRSINFAHAGAGNLHSEIEFNRESAGTKRFFSLAGPFLDILEKGRIVVIDELESSMHPLLVRELLKLFFSSESNSKGAQIIFSTHNPILLDNEIIRRDQVWLTEKNQAGATFTYPLTNYKPRNNESLLRGYLSGRYGAIPFMPEGLKLK